MKYYFLIFVFVGSGCLDEIVASVHHGMNSFVGMPLAPLPFHLKRLQHRSTMFGDYYPQMMPYIPPMTFASGNTDISLQPEIPQTERTCNDCANKDYEDTTQYIKTEIEHSSPIYEEISTKSPSYEESTTQKSRVYTRKPQRNNQDSSEEDENWAGKKYPPMNVFFPMTFGYPYSSFEGQRSNGNGNPNNGSPNPNNPGSVTAIANSFSSGKGGVATSHATAFGNAPPVNFYSNSQKRSHE